MDKFVYFALNYVINKATSNRLRITSNDFKNSESRTDDYWSVVPTYSRLSELPYTLRVVGAPSYQC
jgi:hypothetical protein